MEGNNTTNMPIGVEDSRIPNTIPQQTTSDDRSTDQSIPTQEDRSRRNSGTQGVESNAAVASPQIVEGDSQLNSPISKNQLKKLKRQRIWEERKEDRKRLRKEKKHEKAARKRADLEEKAAEAEAAGLDPEAVLKAEKPNKHKANPVPVTFILDCDFEQYMRDPEIVSLSSQVVRSYSMNRSGAHQAHLFISSFKGKLKTRFETILANNHKKWKGAYFVEEDFRTAAKQASELMAGPNGGEMPDVLKMDGDQRSGQGTVRDTTDSTPVPEPEPDDVDKSVVYLTSESPYTLEKLEPYHSYVIGGLVDRNREKGLCYKRAREMKVRTAKLPIGEYMAMQSRYVLTTNQVVEIMAKWLECGDWGEAFLAVIPKRKGGVLKGQTSETPVSDTDINGGETAQDGQENEGTDDVQESPETVPSEEALRNATVTS